MEKSMNILWSKQKTKTSRSSVAFKNFLRADVVACENKNGQVTIMKNRYNAEKPNFSNIYECMLWFNRLVKIVEE